jgi:2-polyprenyl-6-methoxyphenol hydroxylase-like FAD-dependent oxidoreductase
MWLHRFGFRPTIVELAASVRAGGFAVDFRGDAHRTVLERMGVLNDIRREQTQMGAEDFVDARGRRRASLPAEAMSGDLEILRGDLGRILYEHTRDHVEFVFDDSIVSLVEDEGGVNVTFERGEPRRFDLVIGADGLHSTVRGLRFGPDSAYLRDLGYYVAIFTTDNFLGLDRRGQIFNVPGRAAGVYSARDSTVATVMLVFASAPIDPDQRDVGQQMEVVARAYTGVGWEVPRLLAVMPLARDFYFDAISHVHVPHWSTGRVALVGDAAHGATMGGMGTGSAIVGAYVLAGEIAAAHGDHGSAFARYEQLIRPYATRAQQFGKNVERSLAPGSTAEIWIRNAVLRMLPHLPMRHAIGEAGAKAANGIVLPDYSALSRTQPEGTVDVAHLLVTRTVS